MHGAITFLNMKIENERSVALRFLNLFPNLLNVINE